MNEIMELVRITPAVVNMDFDKVADNINEALMPYRGLAITGDSIGEAKLSYKEVNAIKKEIEDFRKKYKKYLTKPITEFEDKCKELTAIVEDVLAELDNGISEVDAQRRRLQYEKAETIRKNVAEAFGVNAEDIVIKPEHSNLTSVDKDVKTDFEAQAMLLQMKKENEALKASLPSYKVCYEIVGTQMELQSVSEFLKAHGISYKVLSQERA